MKKIWSMLLLIIILSISLIGCSKAISAPDTSLKDNDDIEHQVFAADVIETEEDRVLVSPDIDSTEATSSDKIFVGLSKIKELSELKAGDRIKIFYDGLIAESYPAQITADKIEVTGHNHIIDGFFSIIDDIYQEDSALNHNITMIAFDTGKLDILSKTELDTILAMVGKEYELEVIRGTFDELAEQGLIDKEKLYFEDGVLIEIKNVEINEDKNKITCSISKWRSGKGAIGWDANAIFDDGDWIISRDKAWIS